MFILDWKTCDLHLKKVLSTTTVLSRTTTLVITSHSNVQSIVLHKHYHPILGWGCKRPFVSSEVGKIHWKWINGSTAVVAVCIRFTLLKHFEMCKWCSTAFARDVYDSLFVHIYWKCINGSTAVAHVCIRFSLLKFIKMYK